MSEGKTIRLLCKQCTDAAVATGAGNDVAQVLPLRPADDRRGKYVELRALIDSGLELEVSFTTVT